MCDFFNNHLPFVKFNNFAPFVRKIIIIIELILKKERKNECVRERETFLFDGKNDEHDLLSVELRKFNLA